MMRRESEMYHVIKPMQCSHCKSQNIAVPINDIGFDLVCLECGHKRAKPEITTSNLPKEYTMIRIEAKPYEEF